MIAILLVASTAGAVDPARVHRLHALLHGVEQEYREAFDDAGALARPLELEEAALLLAEAREQIRLLAAEKAADAERPLAALVESVDARATVDVVSARVREIHSALQSQTGIGEEMYPAEPPFAPRGARLFKENCVACHGEQGKGDGPDASRSQTRPADFTDPAFMRDETPADFFSVISLGRRRAAMPGWEDVLGVQERWDLVSYVWSLRELYRGADDGQQSFVVHCASCHAAAAAAEQAPSTPVPPLAALDRMAARSDGELYEAITDGRPGMPAFRTIVGEADRWKLAAFVRTLSLGGDGSSDADAAGGATRLERSLDLTARRVRAAVDAYRLREDGAAGLAAAAYLAFEPIEPAIAAHDAAAVALVEKEFVRLQRALRQPDSIREVDEAAAAVERALDAARKACRAGSSKSAVPLALPLAGAAVLALLAVLGARWIRR